MSIHRHEFRNRQVVVEVRLLGKISEKSASLGQGVIDAEEVQKRGLEIVDVHRIFDRVVDNGRVLRTVFQMVRSGQFGRNGLSILRKVFGIVLLSIAVKLIRCNLFQ